MEKELVYELVMNPDNEESGVDAISFVENPAVQVDFMCFNEASEQYSFKEIDEEKRIAVGVAMVPNQKILRKDAEGNNFFVFFTEDTVRASMEKYFKLSNQTSGTVEHNYTVEGVTVVESWIIEDPKMDKAVALGFSELPKGSWMISYKVDNDELWGDIKSGKVKGFSIEGFFAPKKQQFSEEVVVNEDELVEDIKALLKSGADDAYIESELKKKLITS